MSGLAKAKLRVVDSDVTGIATALTFAFNPGEYTVAKSSTWTRPQMKGGKSTGKPEFTGANAQTLQMEIFLDAWEGGTPDVSKKVATLIEWVKPTKGSLAKKKPQPPILVFEWGGDQALKGFRGYLKSVSAKYLLFDQDGNPTRATANITLEEVPIEPSKTNPTSGGPSGRRTRVLGDGDSLESIAYAEFDDPAMWRTLAAYNGIDDPLRIAPGTRLLIPTTAEAASLP